MGQIETKKLIKIHNKNKKINEIELNINQKLNQTRKKLNKSIDFPFTFLDDDFKELSAEDEKSSTLGDILVGKKLYIKKQIRKRNILGDKIYSDKGLDFYLYPKANLTDIQKFTSSNIMIMGETGVGKSTFIHSLLNYLEDVEIDENIRYLLFNEEQQQIEYQKKYGKKSVGCSITDEPAIYDLEPTKLYNNPLRIIDTTGFGDTRGIEYDNKIIKDIYNLLENSTISNIKLICLLFKASETRATDRLIYIMKKIFSLFSEDVKYNFIFIFTFTDSLTDIPVVKVLENNNLPFYKIFGAVGDLPVFTFNNKVYFDKEMDNIDLIYEHNNKSFEELFKYISKLENKNLKNTQTIIKGRIEIRDQLNEIYQDSNNLNQELNTLKIHYNNSLNDKNEIIDYYNNKTVLYCQNHNKICYKHFKGLKEGSRYNNESGYCNICKCKKSAHKNIQINDDKKGNEYTINFDNIMIINQDFIKSTNKIFHYLMKHSETFYKLLSINKQINSISLYKEKENNQNEFIYAMLNEIIKDKNDIMNFFLDNLKEFENYSNEKIENIVWNFIHTFLNIK